MLNSRIAASRISAPDELSNTRSPKILRSHWLSSRPGGHAPTRRRHRCTGGANLIECRRAVLALHIRLNCGKFCRRFAQNFCAIIETCYQPMLRTKRGLKSVSMRCYKTHKLKTTPFAQDGVRWCCQFIISGSN